MRLILALFAFLTLAAATNTVSADSAVPGDGIQVAESLMQCMTRCIKNEGGNTADNKETCKYRCAKVGAGRGPKRDCGMEFKNCNKRCAKNKACLRSCKKTLMNCS